MPLNWLPCKDKGLIDSGGGQGAGARENRGQEGCGRREGKGREAGFPRWREPGEKRKILQYCVTFYNINRTKRQEPLRKGAGSGSKRYGRWEFQTPLSPPTRYIFSRTVINYYNFFFSAARQTVQLGSLQVRS